MNNATLYEPVAHHPTTGSGDNEFAYRAVSKSAVACFVFAILGAITSWLHPIFVVLPALGTVFGMVALVNFKRFPEELIGKAVSRIGLGVSLTCLVASGSFHSYIIATEVPDGYVRMAYSDLRPNKRTSLPYSEKSVELDGKKVFLKGYVRPGAKKLKLKDFILVGDFGDCCFGGNPEITDVVAIKIITDDTVDYGYSLRRIGGTFKLNKNALDVGEKDVPQVYYEIHADHIR